MSPTYSDGQLVFATPMSRAPRVGEVVLVDKDGATLIKRVTMVGGDHYPEVYVRYAHQWDPVITPAIRRMVREGKTVSRIATIPDGQVFITGDNPDVSIDSRRFGPVPVSSIRGLIQPD